MRLMAGLREGDLKEFIKKNLDVIILIIIFFLFFAIVGHCATPTVTATSYINGCMMRTTFCGTALYRLDPAKFIPGNYTIILPLKTVKKNARGTTISSTTGTVSVTLVSYDQKKKVFTGYYTVSKRPFKCGIHANIFLLWSKP